MSESPSNQAPSPRSSWLVPALVLITVIVLVGGLMRILQGPKPDRKGPVADVNLKKLTREESLKLIELRDRANAYLENLEYKLADESLQQLMILLPDDPLGPRNLTICHEMHAGDERDVDIRQAAVKNGKVALAQLLKLEPDSYVTHVMAARLAIREDDIERADAELRRAVELAPKAAPALYDLYQLHPLNPGERPADESVRLLRRIHELQPDNLFVLKDWLVTQVQIKGPDLAETVVQTREVLAPFAGVIKQHVGLDVEKMLGELATAVQEQNWPMTERLGMMLRNIVAPEGVRDERYIKYNSVEYMLHDFGSAFYQKADLPAGDIEPAKPVKFVKPPQEGQISLPPSARAIVTTDFNFDGKIDAAALYSDRFVVAFPLLPNTGDSPAENVTVEITGDFREMLAADLDDDKDLSVDEGVKSKSGVGHFTDPDLILFGPGGIKLFENRKRTDSKVREFVERPAQGALASLHNVIAVTPGDLDLDGDLDFLTISSEGVRLWSNRSNWTFEEITSRVKLPPAEFAPTAAALVDWDKDSDVDIILAGTSGVGMLENIRHGRFRWRDLGSDFNSLKQSRSLIVEEFDGNGSWDLAGAGPEGLGVVLTTTSAAGVVSQMMSMQMPIRTSQDSLDASVKLVSLDFNNDGRRDLIVQSGHAVDAWRGTGKGDFALFALELEGESAASDVVIVADVDQDGDEDLVRATDKACAWFSNEGGNTNDWLNISLWSDQIKPNEQNYGKRVNYNGIGSTIEMRTGTRYQAQVVKGQITHFGLGKVKQTNVARVLWTNGIPRDLINPRRNVDVYEEMKLIGSCPYLYTWDGEKFVFCTDLLWNAPLGLKFAENVIAPWREWEYLKIDGDKLRAKSEEYPLRVTAELWEIEFFDQIKLYAVDHPAGTQIFNNEKVGPPSMAEHRIYTVREPHVPVAARDPQGRDVLDQVKIRDGVYTRTYERKLAQGLTTEHYLELDLGNWPVASTEPAVGPVPEQPAPATGSSPRQSDAPRRVMLFLTGWMYPATTSLNVQFSQNPDGPKLRPPSLHAVDSNGQWREVRSFMGFPGGKTKTIALDISDVFPSGPVDHRLRIVTNMEFYWDAAFFTVDDEPVPFREAELSLVRAQLRDRGGISLRQWPLSGNGPELFDYDRLVPGDAWPPIEGAFTRYGDVLPLLTSRDDQMVVMHPGDEIQLAFAEPADPLPEGWVRDFVMYNVGWDKDCDLNTVYGETVDPMPFRDMTVYGELRPLDAEYIRYLKTYQTRHRPRATYWNQVRRK